MEDDLAEEDLLKDVLEEASRECKRRKISNKGRKVELLDMYSLLLVFSP
jgi:hypothetical protein